jgi:glycosyltransferase involved in cell wall biosynthesis
VLAFGNIRPYKGLDTLLLALRRMLDSGREANVIVAGQPWGDFGEYERIIEEQGLQDHVRTELEFLPEDRIAELFSAADLAAFPYHKFDGQSGAAALALSFGTAIIVSDTGGLPELVGDERAVVPAGDPAALAERLSAVLSNSALLQSLAAGSRRRAEALGWGRIAQDTARLYRQVAAEGQAER